MTRVERRARRRWLRFWSKHYQPLPAFHTLRTMERLESPTYRLVLNTDEIGVIEAVRFIETSHQGG